MKSFNRFLLLNIILIAAVMIAANVLYSRSEEKDSGLYRIEIERVKLELEAGGTADISGCKAVTGIFTEQDGDIYSSSSEYVIFETGGVLYRIEYQNANPKSSRRAIMNISIGAAAVLIIGTLLYIRRKIIKPFTRLSSLPEKLAKGDLSVELPEEKERYFGKFRWGLSMLRDELEVSRRKEMQRARQEKTQLLSLSHDIKTPLSAIKLYSQAISKGLYTDPDKLSEAAQSINANADEIEGFLMQIIRSSEEDMVSFELNPGEEYMSKMIDELKSRYSQRLQALGTELVIPVYSDCLLSCDAERLLEVIQNIFENAIKYGDGRRIELSFADEEDCRLISVSNTGCTLPEQEIANIFNSFWRGSNTSGKEGSGLGLYICRRLLTAMGGDIFADLSGDVITITAVVKKA